MGAQVVLLLSEERLERLFQCWISSDRQISRYAWLADGDQLGAGKLLTCLSPLDIRDTVKYKEVMKQYPFLV